MNTDIREKRIFDKQQTSGYANADSKENLIDAQRFSEFENGYRKATAAGPGNKSTPSKGIVAVNQAQSVLQQPSSKQYTSPWQSQLNDTINKILNREKFSYDLNGDALYQQYKDQYTNQGRMAMMDTMGQAQAMTGGYGNSYAQSVGQQAYQGYMQQLTDKIPELYQLALSKYQMEGDELAKQYSVLGAQDDRDYGRFADDRAYEYQVGRDQVADEQWQKEFDEAVRQFNFKNKLGEFARRGSSGGSTSRNPSPGPGPGPGPGPDELPGFADVGKTAENIAAAGGSADDYLTAARQAGVISTDQWKSLKYTFGY